MDSEDSERRLHSASGRSCPGSSPGSSRPVLRPNPKDRMSGFEGGRVEPAPDLDGADVGGVDDDAGEVEQAEDLVVADGAAGGGDGAFAAVEGLGEGDGPGFEAAAAVTILKVEPGS